ncbi:MAG: TraR/DksA C4-type zinc finger protein [Planctomycetaceae bacterium]|jgi:RNA polymerase-binding transcription factor DksA|nr:TraR/DksA C4-type zinc finger protein [Planctomycetaceae bacterium]
MKNNKKNQSVKKSKTITKKSVAAKKTTPKKVTKKTTKKVIKKTIAKKLVKKSAASKTPPKKIIKKKNPAITPKKSVKPSSTHNKTTAATKIRKKITKTVKNLTKKITQNIKKILNPKTTTKTSAKPNLTAIKPISNKPKNRNLLKPVVEKRKLVNTPKPTSPQKLTIKPNAKIVEIKTESKNNIQTTFPEIQNDNIAADNSGAILLNEPATKQQLLSEAELDGYRQKLITIRARLRGDVSAMTDAALNKNRMDASGDLSTVPIHMADVGTDNFEQEQTLSFMQNERGILVDIEEALIRIKEGTYGTCEGCGVPIPKVRLNFIPYANMCVKCAELAQNQEEEGN